MLQPLLREGRWGGVGVGGGGWKMEIKFCDAPNFRFINYYIKLWKKKHDTITIKKFKYICK